MVETGCTRRVTIERVLESRAYRHAYRDERVRTLDRSQIGYRNRTVVPSRERNAHRGLSLGRWTAPAPRPRRRPIPQRRRGRAIGDKTQFLKRSVSRETIPLESLRYSKRDLIASSRESRTDGPPRALLLLVRALSLGFSVRDCVGVGNSTEFQTDAAVDRFRDHKVRAARKPAP